MLTTRPGSSVGRAPPRIGVVPGSIPGQVTFGSQHKRFYNKQVLEGIKEKTQISSGIKTYKYGHGKKENMFPLMQNYENE